MRLLIHKYLFFLPIAFSLSTFGQDIHFSQYYSSPANLSPALTGIFDGDYRFVGNQRNQWRSITQPYTFNTFGGSFDANGLYGKKQYGSGISIYNDNGGNSDFNTLQINGAARISRIISKDSTQILSLGLQAGFTQRSINYSKLRFDNQYNGNSYDPNLSNGENLPINRFSYPTINTGVTWLFKPNEKWNVTSGIALHNINKPKQSLFNSAEIKLDRRFTIFANADYKLSDTWTVMPGFFNMFQGKFREHVIGSNAKFVLNRNKMTYRALNFGVWMRTRDAGFFVVGMDYDNVNVGISYDMTISDLNPASNYKGGFEVSVIYILTKFVPNRIKYRMCPSFV